MAQKSFFRAVLAIMVLAAAQRLNANPFALGTVSFVSDKVWTVGGQAWSDVVQATGCSKTAYGSYDVQPGVYNPDCRSNPSQKGSLFSWAAVVNFQDRLCPDGWRVPATEDFKILNSALGGQDVGMDNTYIDLAVLDKYLKLWGASYGGRCNSDGTLSYQGKGAIYWTKSEDKLGSGVGLYIYSDGGIYPQLRRTKGYGFSLRCVK